MTLGPRLRAPRPLRRAGRQSRDERRACLDYHRHEQKLAGLFAAGKAK